MSEYRPAYRGGSAVVMPAQASHNVINLITGGVVEKHADARRLAFCAAAGRSGEPRFEGVTICTYASSVNWRIGWNVYMLNHL
jgi:hypothetical protein